MASTAFAVGEHQLVTNVILGQACEPHTGGRRCPGPVGFRALNEELPSMPRNRQPFAYESQGIASRGFLGGAYRLTPKLARYATRALGGGKVRKRIVAGLTIYVVSRPANETYSLSAVDNVAFVSFGFLFYCLWDSKGRIYITRALEQRLGLDRFDDAALTDIVLAPTADSASKKFLRQLCLYWKTKNELMQGRELTAMESCLATCFDRHDVPIAEGLACLLAVLEEICDHPQEVFALAWRTFYDYPYTQVDDVSHLTEEEIERLTILRKEKMQEAAILERHQEKMHRIRQWLSIYRAGDFHRLDELADDPAGEAEMLYSFLAVVGVPMMDQMASAFYDDAMEKRVTAEEVERGRLLVQDLEVEEPVDLFRRILRQKVAGVGKTLILGADRDWYENEALRQLIASLLSDGLLSRVLAAECYEDRLLLYREFPRDRMLFVQPQNRATGQLNYTDSVEVFESIRSVVKNDESVLIVVPTATSGKMGMHYGTICGLHFTIKNNLYSRHESMICSAIFMDAGFARNGYLIRSRPNALMHGMTRPGLHGIAMDRNEPLTQQLAYPGNHFVPEVKLGELWDVVLYQGPKRNGGGEDDSNDTPIGGAERDCRVLSST